MIGRNNLTWDRQSAGPPQTRSSRYDGRTDRIQQERSGARARDAGSENAVAPGTLAARVPRQLPLGEPKDTHGRGKTSIAAAIPSLSARPSRFGGNYLRFMELKFDNLGLAAAANGGEARIGRYIPSGITLPAETRNYVMIVSGHLVDQWLAGVVGEVD